MAVKTWPLCKLMGRDGRLSDGFCFGSFCCRRSSGKRLFTCYFGSISYILETTVFCAHTSLPSIRITETITMALVQICLLFVQLPSLVRIWQQVGTFCLYTLHTITCVTFAQSCSFRYLLLYNLASHHPPADVLSLVLAVFFSIAKQEILRL